MFLVVDANVALSALSKKGVSWFVFVWNFLLKKFRLIAPEFFWEEVNKHLQRIRQATKLSSEDFDRLMTFFKREIEIVPAKEFIDYLQKAEAISPDPNDSVYFALALAFNCPILSGDPELKKQTVVAIYSPREILNILLGRR